MIHQQHAHTTNVTNWNCFMKNETIREWDQFEKHCHTLQNNNYDHNHLNGEIVCNPKHHVPENVVVMQFSPHELIQVWIKEFSAGAVNSLVLLLGLGPGVLDPAIKNSTSNPNKKAATKRSKHHTSVSHSLSACVGLLVHVFRFLTIR